MRDKKGFAGKGREARMNLSLSTLGKRQMIIIYVLLLLILGVLLYYFAISPELEHFLTARADYHSQQQKEMRLIAQRDALVKEYLVLREKADQIQKLIFTRRQAEDFLETLPKLAVKTKNDLKSIAPRGSVPIVKRDPKAKDNEPTPLEEISQIPVSSTITGGYGDIINLFRSLEEYKELMAISDVNMNSFYENPRQVSSGFSLNLIHLRSAIKQPSYDMLAEILSGGQLVMAAKTEASPEGVKTEEASKLEARELGAGDVSVRAPDAGTKVKPSKRGTPEKRKPGEYFKTVRYSVKVVAPNLEQNLNEVKGLLLSRNQESWMLPFPSTSSRSSQYNLLAGKFSTMEEADAFGKIMQRELTWVAGYEIIEGNFDYDAILKEHRTLKKPGK